ncbi:MAG: hypothetical protein V3U27_20360, partial [Candidatus Tectomicrobia bacterium]
MQHPAEEAIAAICQGLRDFRATGAELVQPYFLSLLAEAYGEDRQIEEGLAALAEALMLVEKNGACWYEAELRRLKGELLLQQPPDNHADSRGLATTK